MRTSDPSLLFPDIRIGILGCAEVAKYALIAPVREVTGLTVSAIAGRDAARAAVYAREQGVPHVYRDYQALIDSDEVDLVYVALPNSHHCEWSIRALERGKAVLCEKPLASNAREAAQMTDAARKSGKPLIEAFHFRYHPLARRLGELMAAGSLGTVRSAKARFCIPGSWLTQSNIRLRYDLAGGAAMDPGCYCVNLLRYIVGEEPEVLHADAQCRDPDVDVAMTAKLSFPGGCVAWMHSSLVHPGASTADIDMWLEVEGDKGKLSVRNPFMPQLGHEFKVETAGGATSESFGLVSTYVFQARDVLKVMNDASDPLTPGADGVANMRVIDQMYLASGLPRRGRC